MLLESVRKLADTQVTSQALVPSVRAIPRRSGGPSHPNTAEPGFLGTCSCSSRAEVEGPGPVDSAGLLWWAS